MSAWTFSGLRVDSLVRSMWYNPQHSMSAALGLLAMPIAGAAGVDGPDRRHRVCGPRPRAVDDVQSVHRRVVFAHLWRGGDCRRDPHATDKTCTASRDCGRARWRCCRMVRRQRYGGGGGRRGAVWTRRLRTEQTGRDADDVARSADRAGHTWRSGRRGDCRGERGRLSPARCSACWCSTWSVCQSRGRTSDFARASCCNWRCPASPRCSLRDSGDPSGAGMLARAATIALVLICDRPADDPHRHLQRAGHRQPANGAWLSLDDHAHAGRAGSLSMDAAGKRRATRSCRWIRSLTAAKRGASFRRLPSAGWQRRGRFR